MIPFLIDPDLAVIPILIGPLQVLLAILPAILAAIATTLISMLKPSSIWAFFKVLWRNKFIVAGIIGAVFLVKYAWSLLPQKTEERSSVAKLIVKDWTMFRGGPSRRGGGVDGMPDPVGGGRIWAHNPEFKQVFCSPTIISNRVYYSGAEMGTFGDRGAIYCLDAITKAQIWKSVPNGEKMAASGEKIGDKVDYRATYSSPVVWSNYMVVGEGTHETKNTRIFCLNAESGRELWSVVSTSHVESTAVIMDGIAFIGAGKQGVFALNLAATKTNEIVLKHWAALTNDPTKTFHCDSSPVGADGRVYFTSAMSWDGVVCVDAKTLNVLWEKEMPYPVWCSPAIASNRLFVGMGNGNMIETAEQVWIKESQKLKDRKASAEEMAREEKRFARGGAVMCLTTNGEEIWTYKLGNTLLGGIAEADGELFFADRDGVVARLSLESEEGDKNPGPRRGKALATWKARGESITTAPAVGKDNVYFVTESGVLLGLDKKTLQPKWNLRLGGPGIYSSSPALGLGHIYVGTANDGLLCVGDVTPPEALWAGVLGGPGKSGWVDGSGMPEKGSLHWRWPGEDDEASSNALTCTAAAYGTNGVIYTGVKVNGTNGVVAVQIKTTNAEGKTTRGQKIDKWLFPTTLPVSMPLATMAQKVYAVEGKQGDAGRKLHAIDAITGKALWSVPVAADASGEMILTREGLYACVEADTVSMIGIAGAATGKASVVAKVGKIAGAMEFYAGSVDVVDRPPATFGEWFSKRFSSSKPSEKTGSGLLIVATDSPPAVKAIRVSDNKTLWEAPLPAAPVSGPVAGDDIVAVATAKGLHGLSIVNGGLYWTVDCKPAGARLVCDGEQIMCLTADSEALFASWHGKIIRQPKLKSPVTAIAPLLLSDRLVYCDDKSGAVRQFEFAKGTDSMWFDGKLWLAGKKMDVNIMLLDGYVYLGSSEMGLFCVRRK